MFGPSSSKPLSRGEKWTTAIILIVILGLFATDLAINYSMGKLTGTASGPIGETFAYRISGNIHQRDGFYSNAGGEDLSDVDDWNVQAKLLWEPTDRLSLLLSLATVERDTTCCGTDSTQSDEVNEELVRQGFAPDQNDPYDYRVAADAPYSFDMESDLVSLHIDYDADWGTITSITVATTTTTTP